MTPRFTTTRQASARNGVKLLVYSDAGVGKTVLNSTMPSPVILSAEAGLLSLRQFELPVIEIANFGELVDAYQWCARSNEARQFASVSLDSLTEIAEVVLTNEKGAVKDPRQAYGALLDKMTKLIRDFRDLPGKHVYMSAQMEPSKDEYSGVIKYGPSMPGGKLAPKLPYFFDEMFALRIGQQQGGPTYRFIQTQPDVQYRAKDRSGALDPIEPPHLGHIINKILGV